MEEVVIKQEAFWQFLEKNIALTIQVRTEKGYPPKLAKVIAPLLHSNKKQVASIGLLTPKRRGNPIDEEKGVW